DFHVTGVQTCALPILIAEVVGDLPKQLSLRILGVGQVRTTGLRRGVVADIEETTRAIRQALADAERMAGAKVDGLYVGIAGEHEIGRAARRERVWRFG